jgi:hypothetical protein
MKNTQKIRKKKMEVEFIRKKVRGEGRQIQVNRMNFFNLSFKIFCKFFELIISFLFYFIF